MISTADSNAARGASVVVRSAQAADVTKVALVRPGAVTHQINTDQRHLFLSFTTSGDALTAQLPSNTNLTPPGYYMLFLLNALGVPSLATWVQLT